jgi:hypothetical protein
LFPLSSPDRVSENEMHRERVRLADHMQPRTSRQIHFSNDSITRAGD